MSVLEVENLRIEIEGTGIDIVDEISFHIEAGEVLGLVGESGSGKTTVGLSLLGHQRRGAKIVAGQVRVDGKDILERSPAQLRALRGGTVSYVPQDPSAALNPHRSWDVNVLATARLIDSLGVAQIIGRP